MIKWVVRIWVGLAIVVPALLGLALIFSPSQFAPAGITIESVAGMVGVRNVVYSGVTVAAALMLGPKGLGVVIAGRGATDLLDGLRGLVGGEAISTVVFPLVTSILSFGVAYLLLSQSATSTTPTPAVPQRKGR